MRSLQKTSRSRLIGACGIVMLTHGRAEAKRLGFSKRYLCIDPVGYYEKYGWTYIADGYDANGDDSRIYEVSTE